MGVTPLFKKLGIKSDSTILVLNQPHNYLSFFNDFPENVVIQETVGTKQFEFIHLFATTLFDLEINYALAKSCLTKNGILWISWPKKASKMKTELDKEKVRTYGLDNGLVDTKVVSVDDNWSGHKFMYRVNDR